MAVIHRQTIPYNVAFLRTAEAASASSEIQVAAIDPPDLAAIEPSLTAFTQEPNGGLIVTPNPPNSRDIQVVSGLAARLRLPAIYPYRLFSDKERHLSSDSIQ